MDIDGIKDMMQAMGLSVSTGAQKLMSDIEHQQKQVCFSIMWPWTNVKTNVYYFLHCPVQHILQRKESLG